jgi:hypothetical protein
MKIIKLGTKMNKNKTLKTLSIVGIITAGFMHCGALAQSSMIQPLPPIMIPGSNSYAGAFYAYVKGTNSSGGFSITPSIGVQSCTVSDVSGFPAPYSSCVIASRRDTGHTWYTNQNCSLIFPVTNTLSYTIMLYVTSVPPPPTNGQPLMLQIAWSTNSLACTNSSQ